MQNDKWFLSQRAYLYNNVVFHRNELKNVNLTRLRLAQREKVVSIYSKVGLRLEKDTITSEDTD